MILYKFVIFLKKVKYGEISMEETDNNIENNLKKLTPAYVILMFSIVELASGLGKTYITTPVDETTAFVIFWGFTALIAIVSIILIWYIEIRRKPKIKKIHIKWAIRLSIVFSVFYIINSMMLLFNLNLWWFPVLVLTAQIMPPLLISNSRFGIYFHIWINGEEDEINIVSEESVREYFYERFEEMDDEELLKKKKKHYSILIKSLLNLRKK